MPGKADDTDQKTPKLLSGGNPQIPKGDGDAPVQAYIAAMPGWKSATGRRIDAIISQALPDVRKAVKWNTPFYGAADQPGWFLSFHCFDRYIKLGFLTGTSLDPEPPISSKVPNVRYWHLHEADEWEDAQLADWVLQASRIPGQKL
ncbi:DUF1801 domain-containing protein [Altererythrobacter xixiisoli]|uniref:DUF1801 domain-containing protein n=1 Tax=Croceibacterium xixiisoli TaxID=1476466 RepID=A0A6I4TU23_9SPHN|nr:DUF1801 domain-containing protein [Croceibacterium xixiisoli]MXO98809.1 DUF1801 domain-containing protein [Croceibacterium xixiisoli]